MYWYVFTNKNTLIFQRGEKMTADEVNAIFTLADINKDGKLNYAEVNVSWINAK